MFISSTVFATDLPITSEYGWRIHPIYGDSRFHSGLDLGYEYGTPIPAMFNGSVVACGDFDDGYGNQVMLYHEAYDCYTRYAHCSCVTVEPGQYVYAGNIIGYVGSTGNSTGPHLHLEYIIRSDEGNYVFANPIVLF